MPGDSLLIRQMIDSFQTPDTSTITHTLVTPGHSDSSLYSFFFVGGLTGCCFLFKFLQSRNRRRLQHKAALNDLQENFQQYDEWLQTYNGYYAGLSPALRLRFAERVAWFMHTKEFHYIDTPQDEKLPLLISAASVQISFGLNKYLLDFFDTIYIMQHSYHYGFSDKPFEGHVSSNGIYLSVDNFYRGFENYSDGDNVGIHEMAHALAYVNFMAGASDDKDSAFIERFYAFSAVARPIFNDMQQGKYNLLNNYAATNYNEFWAVSVETFFEQSQRMKTQMPDLYMALCHLLNQDPLLPDKVLTI